MTPALAEEMAARFGTPYYAYDLERVREQARRLRSWLPEGSALYYSLKANPLPVLAAEARLAGCRAEVTSTGELAAALTAGWQAADLLVGGPAKSESLLRAALQAGAATFSCESRGDLARLSAICVELGQEVAVLLRVNPQEAPEARLAMSGVESQFGFAEQELAGNGSGAALRLPGLQLRGVHVYFGTQVAGAEAVALNTRRALACAERVCAALGLECAVVNAGGGFPWPYASDTEAPRLEGLRDLLAQLWDASPLHRQAQLWFESGRYIAAAAGVLVARVMEVKSVPGRTFVLLDTGIHHLGGMSGLGRVPRSALTVRNLSRPGVEAEMVADLVGPLCTPLDCLGRAVKMPKVTEGDLVAIPNTGAYGLTASLTSFLTHPAPLEIAHRAGKIIEVAQLRGGHASLDLSS
jgi:diaminopimelate decarboxylase